MRSVRSVSGIPPKAETTSVVYTIDYAKRLGLDRLPDARAERCLAALDRVQGLLGPRWLVESYGHSQSLGIVTELLRLVDDWPLVAGLAGADSLLKRLRASRLTLRRAAMLELFVVARFIAQGLEVVLESAQGPGRNPDCSLRIDNCVVYVEISLRGQSIALTNAFATLMTLGAAAAFRAPDRRNSIHVRRPIGANETAEIAEWLLTRTSDRDRLRDFAVYDSRSETEESPREPEIQAALERSLMVIGRGIASMPLGDAAADQLIDDEARQLPAGQCGVLCLDVTGAGLMIDQWETLIRTRLQPSINTRVAAVALLVRYAGDDDFETRVRVLTNPHAAVPASVATLAALRGLASAS